VLNAAMLLGLFGVAVPLLIHLFNRRLEHVVEWGAMQFLDLGRRARQRIHLSEWLLMMARMALLALVALALARPFWTPAAADVSSAASGRSLQVGASAPPRDIVLVLDRSASMERRAGGTTPHTRAVRWARQFVTQLRPGDSVAVLLAGERVSPLIDPPSFDRARIDAALAALAQERPHGSSDLPAALAEAFRVLERTGNPARDVIVLTDGQRSAWRPEETRRWSLVRNLQHRLDVPPRVWALALGAGVPPDAPNGAVGPLVLNRTLATPDLPITVTTTLASAGPGALSRTAELFVDGCPVPGSALALGPLPAGARTPLSFRTSVHSPGTHALAVRLVGGDDALPADDESTASLTVTSAVPVLLVDGKPGLEPYSGATDFLRAALAPAGDRMPQVHALVVAPAKLGAVTLQDQRVVILARVDRVGAAEAAALDHYVSSGGGVLIAPGEHADPAFFNGLSWTPARLGALRGNPVARQSVGHPAPSTFSSPALAPFAEGDAPPLAEAEFFASWVLNPSPGASVAARLDNGDPWIVERPHGRGRVLLLATALDAAAGTLPVNPDFVPLVHECVFALASAPVAGGPADASQHVLQREADFTTLEPTEGARLAEGWPLTFETDPVRLEGRVFAAERGGRRELWRGLVLVALAGLCLEVYLTRRLVRTQGLATVGSEA
jgi:hypothetical protein